jgi:hypothetical protein
LESILALTFLTIGALVAARRPRNVIGWTFCAAGSLARSRSPPSSMG